MSDGSPAAPSQPHLLLLLLLSAMTVAAALMMGGCHGSVTSSHEPSLFRSNPVAPGPRQVVVGDLNADGKADLVVVCTDPTTDSGVVTVWLGNGDGTFFGRRDYPVGPNALDVAIADVDSNRVPDLLVTNYHPGNGVPGGDLAGRGPQRLTLLLGNGDGTFTIRRDFVTGPAPRALAVADLDGDGNLDVATACDSAPGVVSVLFGHGDGTFPLRRNFQVPDHPFSIVIADFDGDHRPDLAVASRLPSQITVLLNNGTGTFRNWRTVSTGPSPAWLLTADFNRDGLLDFLTPDSASTTVSLLLGDASVNYPIHRTFDAGPNPTWVALADLNADSVLDLLVAAPPARTVWLLRGQGNGTFAPKFALRSQGAAYFVLPADIDGDGKPDLVELGVLPDQVSVLLNRDIGPVGKPLPPLVRP